MNRKSTLCLWIVVAVLLAGLPAAAQTLDEIIAQNIETRGGIEALKAVESARMVGRMAMGEGMEAPFTIEFKRPAKVRVEFEMQGMTGIQAFDGETGWSVMPFMGTADPQEMADDQVKEMKERGDWIEGPLLDYGPKGHTVELVGTEEIEGTEAHKLKVTTADGDVMHMYLDTEYCLEFKRESRQQMQGMEIDTTATIGDYKEVGDIVVAHSVMSTIGDGTANFALTIDKVELNLDLDDERFTMPEPPPPAEEETQVDG
ncbi:MAG: hypothetical protein GY856_49955 [bacterium]|nr:hypothetical protein [bacterium]